MVAGDQNEISLKPVIDSVSYNPAALLTSDLVLDKDLEPYENETANYARDVDE